MTLFKKVGKHVVHAAIKAYGNDIRTLDIGCGRGLHRDAFPNLVGMDIAPWPEVDVTGDAHDLPFDDQEFEQVLCSEVMEHLHTPQVAVAEMARVMKPGGLLILTMPMIYPIHEAPHDYQRFTEYGLKRLLNEHFTEIDIKALYNEEQTLAILLQRIVFQRKNSLLRSLFYNFVAQILFRMGPRGQRTRSQSISDHVEGPFLTAGYFVTARKPG